MSGAKWEYAVLCVKVTEMTSQKWTFQAIAWSDQTEIYNKTLSEMYWSLPLADFGREGWELVGTTSENALMGSWVTGFNSSTSRPIQTNFFFKRPATATPAD